MAKKYFTLLITALFFYVVFPLFLPVVLAVVFAVLLHPWLGFLQKRKWNRWVASSFLTFSFTVMVLIPAAIIMILSAKAGLEQIGHLKGIEAGSSSVVGESFLELLVEKPFVQKALNSVSSFFPVEPQELVSAARDLTASIGIKVADILGSLLTQLPALAIALAVVVVGLFFFLLDGHKLVNFVRNYSFFSKRQTETLLGAFAKMCRSVILAIVVSGAVQTLIFSVACLVTDTPNVTIIAFAVFLTSFIPVVGSLPATLTVVLYQVLIANYPVAIALFIVAIIVTVLDNFIRPLILKGAGDLHPLLAFISAFGGLELFGLAGVFLGPIIAGLFIVTIQIVVDDKKKVNA